MFKKIAPGFLNRLDTYLLTNYPVVWISKIHYVLWFGLVLYFLSAAIGWLVPIDLTSKADDGLWYLLLSVLAFILSWFWAYRYLIFNKEKNFGNLRSGEEYKNFFLVFICIAIFAWFGSPFVVSYNTKMARLFTDKELFNDVNTLNEIEPFIPTNYYSYENTYDTTNKRTYFNVNKINVYNNYTPWRFLNDSITYPQVKSNYRLRLGYQPTADFNAVKAKVERHILICNKYGVYPNFDASEMAANYIKAQKTGWLDIQEMNLGGDYYKEQLRTAFNNLFDAKFGKLFIWDKDFLWGMFYVIFSLSLMLILFKLNSWQQYLITAIVMALYPLLAFIISQIFFSSSNSEHCFQWFIFLLFLTSIVSLFVTGKQQRSFKPFFNILNQLFYLIIIYMPMMIVYYLRRYTSVFHDFYSYNYSSGAVQSVVNIDGQQVTVYDYRYYLDQYLYSYWQEEYDLWFMLCKYLPIILFLACLPLMKKLFVKQLALPRRT
ncbi:MAG: hypothetical protein H0U95_15125 [Bacteroidetes bacterium]|nr:hypothetical protein [Bacteroidota bacterium]